MKVNFDIFYKSFLLKHYYNCEASALPFKTTSVKDLETTAKCVILVEKDTVFRKLLQDNILHSSLGNIIILTVVSLLRIDAY